MSNEWYVGQTVLMVSGYPERAPQEVTVTKVGRTLVTIQQYGRDVTFRMDTGIDSKHYAGYPVYLYTKERWAEKGRRAVAFSRLKELGFTQERNGGEHYSTDTIEALVEILIAALGGS